MVSLGESIRGSGFFGEDPQPHDEDVLIHPGSIITDEDPRFSPIRTTWISILLLLLLVAVEILIFVLPLYCSHSQECHIEATSVLVYLQVAFWGLLVLVDQCLRAEHRRIRHAGFLQFYRETRIVKRAPLYIFSIGNALLLILQVILQDLCSSKQNCQVLKPVEYLQVAITAEVLITLPFVVVYLKFIVSFNRKKPVPDVSQDDMLSHFGHVRIPTAEIGYRDEDEDDEVIMKQADVIRYLKQHNMMLGRKIIQITAELHAHKSV